MSIFSVRAKNFLVMVLSVFVFASCTSMSQNNKDAENANDSLENKNVEIHNTDVQTEKNEYEVELSLDKKTAALISRNVITKSVSTIVPDLIASSLKNSPLDAKGEVLDFKVVAQDEENIFIVLERRSCIPDTDACGNDLWRFDLNTKDLVPLKNIQHLIEKGFYGIYGHEYTYSLNGKYILFGAPAGNTEDATGIFLGDVTTDSITTLVTVPDTQRLESGNMPFAFRVTTPTTLEYNVYDLTRLVDGEEMEKNAPREGTYPLIATKTLTLPTEFPLGGEYYNDVVYKNETFGFALGLPKVMENMDAEGPFMESMLHGKNIPISLQPALFRIYPDSSYREGSKAVNNLELEVVKQEYWENIHRDIVRDTERKQFIGNKIEIGYIPDPSDPEKYVVILGRMFVCEGTVNPTPITEAFCENLELKLANSLKKL